jgi:uncharacterized protein (TIGR02246 family)
MTADQDTDVQAIEKLDVAWSAAATRHDLEEVLALYTDDAALLWPGEPPVQGIADIRTAWTGLLKTPGITFAFTSTRIDVAVSRDFAVDFGSAHFTQTPPSGPIAADAKYLVVWKRVGDVWKVYYDSFSYNTDSPA